MPRRELDRRVDTLERAAGTDDRAEIGRVLAELGDPELEAADEATVSPTCGSDASS
jgi:hypothetical protein